MKLKRVVDEIKKSGNIYYRGDSAITYSDSVAVMSLNLKKENVINELLPDLPHRIKKQIKYPTWNEIEELSGDLNIDQGIYGEIHIANIDKTVKKAVTPLVEFANKIKYPDVHITRRAGSYILILDQKAVYVTKSLIENCPLPKTLFTRYQYDDDLSLEERIQNEIDRHAIGEYKMFGKERTLRECEKRVTWGASEIMMDAMEKGNLDCAVEVSDGIGTVLAFDPESVQGIGAVMTGTFYTTPVPELIERCYDESLFPVFPETAHIDQAKGVEVAKDMLGKRKIAVTTAADYNQHLDKIASMEDDETTIYRFALCSTGIKKETAEKMAEHGDLVWSCASKYARELIAPKAKVQLGLMIPVYVMTERGWDIAKSRIIDVEPKLKDEIEGVLELNEVQVIAKGKDGKLTIQARKDIDHSCIDCPHPLV